MQFKQENENIATMNNTIPVPRPSSLVENDEVQRIRKTLTIILSVCLILSLWLGISQLFPYQSGPEIKSIQRDIQIREGTNGILIRVIAVIGILSYAFGLIGILLNAFGLFVTRRYVALGLKIFAWLNIIGLVAIGILILLTPFYVMITFPVRSSFDHTKVKRSIASTVVDLLSFNLLIFIADLILSVFIIVFSFTLARLINANKRLITQETQA